MNILTDLRVALDAALASEQTKGKAWDDFRDLLYTDTIRALLDVAEAAQEQNERYCSGITDENIDEEVRIALAPLVKERGL